MENDRAFYQYLFQHDTLYKVAGSETEPVALSPALNPATTDSASLPAASEKPAIKQESAKAPSFPPTRYPVVVLVNTNSGQEIPADQLEFLANVMKAVGHDLSGVDVIPFHTKSAMSIRETLAAKRIRHLISFGVPFIKLDMDLTLPPYVASTIESTQFLLVEGLDMIKADVGLKRKLWASLQQMFAIR